jgi:sugar O-acyltransferase (sialic acid O-acetyltransferase NeuD family)
MEFHLKKEIVIFGAGGHAQMVLGLISQLPQYEVVGVVDPSINEKHWKKSIPLISLDQGMSYSCGVVAIGNSLIRHNLMKEIKEIDRSFHFPSLVHPSAFVDPTASLGEGVVVSAMACINPFSQIGSGCIINTACVVEHGVVLGEFVFIGPSATLGGEVSIGEFSLIGLGAKVRQGIKIGSHAVLAMGSTLVQDQESQSVYIGSPAKFKKNKAKNEFYF